MHFAQLVLLLAAAYCSVGLLWAVFFVIRGVGLVDSATHGATRLFRILILPGSAVLWPLVLAWWAWARRRANRS